MTADEDAHADPFAHESVLQDVAASLDVERVSEQVGRHCVAVIPEMANRKDKSFTDETVYAALSNVSAIADGLADPTARPISELSAPEATLAWVSNLVERGVSASTVARCYSVGQAVFDREFRAATSRLGAPDAAKWAAADVASTRLYEYVDNVSAEVIEHFELVRARWMRGADSIRAEVVLDIVEGRPVDHGTASATLGYRLDSAHVAMLVWVDPGAIARPPLMKLKNAVASLGRQVGRGEPLIVPFGASEVWAWVAAPHADDVPVPKPRLEAPLMAAIGSPSSGFAGFVSSHAEAREARRMAGLLGHRPGTVTRYHDVAMSALLTNNLDSAGQFVRRELGVLAEQSERNHWLRETLRVYFEEGMSWGRAAKRLCVHQNTVIYRVKQIEDMLGHKVTERRLEMEVALRLAEAETLREPGSADGAPTHAAGGIA